MDYPKELYTLSYGDLLKTMRKDRNITVLELAHATGSTVKNIESWEEGTMAPWMPNAKLHDKIAEALGDEKNLLNSLVVLEREMVTIPLKGLAKEVRDFVKTLKIYIEAGKPPSVEEAIQIIGFIVSDEEVE